MLPGDAEVEKLVGTEKAWLESFRAALCLCIDAPWVQGGKEQSEGAHFRTLKRGRQEDTDTCG